MNPEQLTQIPSRARVIHVNTANRECHDWQSRPNEYVYIGRNGKFGEGKWGTTSFLSVQADDEERGRVFEEHRQQILEQVEGSLHFRSLVMSLHDKILVCFCRPKSCHGDTLASVAEGLYLEHQAALQSVQNQASRRTLFSLEQEMREKKEAKVRKLIQDSRRALETEGVEAWREKWKNMIAVDRKNNPDAYQLVSQKLRFDYRERNDLD